MNNWTGQPSCTSYHDVVSDWNVVQVTADKLNHEALAIVVKQLIAAICNKWHGLEASQEANEPTGKAGMKKYWKRRTPFMWGGI